MLIYLRFLHHFPSKMKTSKKLMLCFESKFHVTMFSDSTKNCYDPFLIHKFQSTCKLLANSSLLAHYSQTSTYLQTFQIYRFSKNYHFMPLYIHPPNSLNQTPKKPNLDHKTLTNLILGTKEKRHVLIMHGVYSNLPSLTTTS